MLDVGDVRHAVHELGDIGGTAGGFQIAAAVKLVGERYQVDGLLRLAEGDHLLVDAPVMIVEEVFGFELLECGVERVVVEQDRAQDAALRLRVLGQLAFKGCGRGAHRKFALCSPARTCLVKCWRERVVTPYEKERAFSASKNTSRRGLYKTVLVGGSRSCSGRPF